MIEKIHQNIHIEQAKKVEKEILLKENELNNNIQMSIKKNNQRKISPFIIKLIAILDDPESRGAIQWVSTDTFAIVETTTFSKNILPKYCKHQNLSSFIRQLNVYGFNKVKNTGEQQLYINPNFIKGSRKRLKLIQRRSNIKAQSHEEYEETQNLLENIKELREENAEFKRKNQKILKKIRDLQEQRQSQIKQITYVMGKFINEKLEGYRNQKQQQGYHMLEQILSQIHLKKEQKIVDLLPLVKQLTKYFAMKNFEVEQTSSNEIQPEEEKQKLERQQRDEVEIEEIPLFEMSNYDRIDDHNLFFAQSKPFMLDEQADNINNDYLY